MDFVVFGLMPNQKFQINNQIHDADEDDGATKRYNAVHWMDALSRQHA